MTNGPSHSYHLGESTFIFGDIRCDFRFLFTFSMNFLYANRIASDRTPHFAASHLGLFCLPTSQKKDARLKLVKPVFLSDLFTIEDQPSPVQMKLSVFTRFSVLY